MPRQFRLPMTLTNLMSKKGTRWIAHSLDFDLVETGSHESEAWEHLMLAVKTYVEFGLSKGWDDFIIQTAPDGVQAAPGKEVKVMPPIELASTTRGVIVLYETELVA